MASPAPKKWGGGPNHVSLLVSSKSYNIHTWGTPPPLYVKKTFQRICANPKRGLNRSGGSGPLHSPPWRRHCTCLHNCTFPVKSRFIYNDVVLSIDRRRKSLIDNLFNKSRSDISNGGSVCDHVTQSDHFFRQ